MLCHENVVSCTTLVKAKHCRHSIYIRTVSCCLLCWTGSNWFIGHYGREIYRYLCTRFVPWTDRKESNVPKLRRSYYYPNIYTVIVDLTMYFPRSKLKKKGKKEQKKNAAAPPFNILTRLSNAFKRLSKVNELLKRCMVKNGNWGFFFLIFFCKNSNQNGNLFETH